MSNSQNTDEMLSVTEPMASEQPLSKVEDNLFEPNMGSTSKSAPKPLSKAKEAKKLKRQAQQFQNNPQMLEMLKQLQHQQMQSASQDPKTKLRERLYQSRLDRAGPVVQKSIKDKAKIKDKEKHETNTPLAEKTKEEREEEIRKRLQHQVKNSLVLQGQATAKKAHKAKMKKLTQKYGQVSFDRYSQALKVLEANMDDSQSHLINQEKNIIELYLKQNPKTNETQLDLGVISDEDMEDLEVGLPVETISEISVTPSVSATPTLVSETLSKDTNLSKIDHSAMD